MLYCLCFFFFFFTVDEDEDYLTCGKCMTEFRLDKISSFIKHKKQDCREPVEELKTGLQAGKR